MAYTAGLVGVTGVGRHHGPAYRRVEGIELAAIADLDEEGLSEYGEAWGVPAERRYTSHGAMLDAEDLDVVDVSTPAFLHRDHVVDAARSPAAPDLVFAEKPIATSVSDAAEMVDVCAGTDTELIVDHTRRFTGPYRALRRLVREEGLIGELRAAHVQSTEELLANGTHTVDLLVYLFGLRGAGVRGGYLTGHAGRMEAQADVSAEQLGAVYDDVGGGGTIIADDGAYVTVDHTAHREISPAAMQFIGTDGIVQILDEGLVGGGEWRYFRSEGYGDRREVALPAPLSDGPSFDWPEGAFDSAVSHLVAVLDGEEENLSPGEHATHVLELVVGMFVSHYTGGAVDVPMARPLRDVEIRH